MCLFAEQGLDLRKYMTAEDATGLQEALVSMLENKEATHWLDKGMTGATKHLAMLGG